MDFITGGLAAVGAGLFTNPLDVIKIRMQLQGELKKRRHHVVHFRNTFHAFFVVAKTDGLFALQSGLVPALWTQLFLNGFRLGTYQFAASRGFTTDQNGHNVLYKNIIVGAIGGMTGAIACSPFFLVKTQLQSASKEIIAVGHQHHHKGMMQALKKIYKQNGIKGLWRGIEATTPRAGIGSVAQLTSFAYCKEWMNKYEMFVDNPILTSFFSSLVGGIAVSLAMTPFDLVTIRLYNQGIDTHGRGLLYNGIADCVVKIWRTEGFMGFYKGLIPNYIRMGPHTVLCLVFWDQLKSVQFKYL